MENKQKKRTKKRKRRYKNFLRNCRYLVNENFTGKLRRYAVRCEIIRWGKSYIAIIGNGGARTRLAYGGMDPSGDSLFLPGIR